MKTRNILCVSSLRAELRNVSGVPQSFPPKVPRYRNADTQGLRTLNCGGKRSATPLFAAAFVPTRQQMPPARVASVTRLSSLPHGSSLPHPGQSSAERKEPYVPFLISVPSCAAIVINQTDPVTVLASLPEGHFCPTAPSESCKKARKFAKVHVSTLGSSSPPQASAVTFAQSQNVDSCHPQPSNFQTFPLQTTLSLRAEIPLRKTETSHLKLRHPRPLSTCYANFLLRQTQLRSARQNQKQRKASGAGPSTILMAERDILSWWFLIRNPTNLETPRLPFVHFLGLWKLFGHNCLELVIRLETTRETFQPVSRKLETLALQINKLGKQSLETIKKSPLKRSMTRPRPRSQIWSPPTTDSGFAKTRHQALSNALTRCFPRQFRIVR
jgi:hypothetical protein